MMELGTALMASLEDLVVTVNRDEEFWLSDADHVGIFITASVT